MKILTLSLDNSIFNVNSNLAKRIIEYSSLLEKNTVVVPNFEDRKLNLNQKVNVIGVGGSHKITVLLKIFNLAKSLLKEEKYDIISVQDPYYLAFVALILAKKLHKGLEIQVHGWEKFYGLRKLAAFYVLPRADALRTVSQRLKRQLIARFKVKENKITVVPIYAPQINLIDDSAIQPRNIDNNKTVLLTVGRLVPVKNIKLQLKAMSEIITNYQNIELWIIGEGVQKTTLQKIVKKLGLDNSVKFFGWQENLANFYKQADIFLLTSNFEGWGMAVIEAASYNLPIIMTDVGCAGEVIKNRQSGLVIPVGGLKKLKEALIKLLDNKLLRKELGEQARQAIKNLPNKGETLSLYKKSWDNCLISCRLGCGGQKDNA